MWQLYMPYALSIQRTARKYLRGPVVDVELRAATEERIDGLPDSAFAGERVRSFVAVSSWFWYCYPGAQPEDDSEDSRPKGRAPWAKAQGFHPNNQNSRAFAILGYPAR
jgi:hypothetical protein